MISHIHKLLSQHISLLQCFILLMIFLYGFKDIISLINITAPVKAIYKNKNEKEIVSMFNEIVSEIKKIELRNKIETLEDKVSLNLDENLYTELLSLRNQLKGG